ncbi:hypothetical protein Rmar_2751 [Rhodothermus marinus DSM 4252]|uniref:Uncharacterized protein n=1 Tax=Rhodothermus marinus (strain ATCC 43812 / DSM 4252 / R-10) TaxID=518766 RepID=D0MGQ8_RHOM4|nr:hypothetical protein Rmar_2751 [Rhodothermus marinus DSM 4252]AEN74653.1 hypothetical protein Rhom172_2769 [Rhodothermus marinus SG0.5JP17-172]
MELWKRMLLQEQPQADPPEGDGGADPDPPDDPEKSAS